MKKQQLNNQTGEYQYFRNSAGLVFFQRIVNWLFAEVYKLVFIPKQKRINIPLKKSSLVGLTIYISNVSQTQAMFFISYPFIIMAKSCSLVSVILVGVFCSRVRSKQLKLGPNKIIVAILTTLGIIGFKVFDPNFNIKDDQKTQLIGLLLVLISLFADGFTPDFQAQIKQKFQPQPMIMLIQVNKWVTIFCLGHIIATLQIFNIFIFFWQHPQFTIDALILGLTTFIGQIFVYRMIKQFKQHIAPFVITTRKIMTVALSIIYYHHATSIGQILSIIVVFLMTLFQLLSNVSKKGLQSNQQYKLLKQPKGHRQFGEIKTFQKVNQMVQNKQFSIESMDVTMK